MLSPEINAHVGDDVFSRMKSVTAIAEAHADDVDQKGRFPHEAVQALRDQRLLGIMIPRELGGEDVSVTDIAELCAILGRGCSSAGMIYAMHQIKMTSLVRHGGGHPWHRAFMQRAAAKQLLLASATTEQGIGGDLRNSICAVTPDGSDVVIEKEASVISYGRESDAILVTARRSPDAASSDQVMVVIERNQCELTQTFTWDALGMRGTTSLGFALKARVPAEQVLPVSFAEIAAHSMLASAHLLWGSLWFGIASATMTKAQAFVRAEARRMPNTVPPNARRLAAAVTELSALKALIQDGLARFERARHNPDELNSFAFGVAMNAVKVQASQRAVAIAQEALTIIGIAGYRNDTRFSVARQLRDLLSAPLQIANDRVIANTSAMLLMSPLDIDLEEMSYVGRG